MKELKSVLALIVLILIVICVLNLTGCKNKTNDKDNDYLALSSQMVRLKDFDDNSGLCYDRDTKIVYIYSSNKTYMNPNIVSYSPYYVMDANGNPTIKVYK